MRPRLTLGGRVAKVWRSFVDPPGLDALLDMLDPGVPVEEVPRWHIIGPCVLLGIVAAAALIAVTFAIHDLAALLTSP